jgi:hypothetical protein
MDSSILIEKVKNYNNQTEEEMSDLEDDGMIVFGTV